MASGTLPRGRRPRALLEACALLLLGAVCAALVPYLLTPVYQFPAPRAFEGSCWYNPYATRSGGWRKVNLHAHARCWGGFTNGHQPAHEVVGAYRQMGFELAAISNYHDIERDCSPIAVYEFGYSIRKTHVLAIGARGVRWLDFPLLQTRHHKQLGIDSVRDGAELVALTHPHARHGYSVEDLRWLGGYDFVEALNVHGDSLEEWDSALTSGHAVWCLGGDDNHDLSRSDRLGVRWTLVDAPSVRPQDVLAALRAGRHLAVKGTDGKVDVRVRSVEVRSGALEIALDGVATRITFVSAGGVQRASAEHVSKARYVLRPDDPYVRIEVETPATTLYLNPVVRYDGKALPSPRPSLDVTATALLRAGLLLLYGGIAFVAARMARRGSFPGQDVTERIVVLAALTAVFSVVCLVVQTIASRLHTGLDLAATHGSGQVVFYGLVLAWLWMSTAWVWGRAPVDMLAAYWRQRRRVVAGFAVSAAVTLLAAAAVTACAVATGLAHVRDENGLLSALGQIGSSGPRGPLSIALACGVAVLLASLEEAIYRGFVLGFLRVSRTPAATAAAVAISAAFFAASHEFRDPLVMFDGWHAGLQIGLFVLGLTLGIAYCVTDTLACGAGIHAALIWVMIVQVRLEPVVFEGFPVALSRADDARTLPVAWALMLALGCVFFVVGRSYRARFGVEDAGAGFVPTETSRS